MRMRMNFLFSVGRLAPALKMALTNAALLGLLLAGGCGKTPEPVTEATPEPAHTPTSTKPSLVVQPPASIPTPAATKVVYVATAFQAVNSDGTHDFPARAAVNVIEEEGEEYVIEYQGVSVRTPKTFFTATLAEEAAVPEPSPVAAAPTPDTIPLSSEGPLPETAAVPTEATPTPVAEATPVATPDPAMATDAAKTTELISAIKTLNDEIRSASDKLEVAPAAEKSEEAARIEKLKKRRDRLSENLTEVAKP